MIFDWDPRKSATNFRKHGVSFAEAGTVFGDELSITVPDPNHSDQEERFLTIGWSNLHRLLMVAHADRGENLRIISARELTKTERKAYEEAN
jgi:hypothetical protein